MVNRNYFRAFVAGMMLTVGYIIFEPMIAQGQQTDNVTVSLTVTSGITISNGPDITLTALSTSQHSAVGNTSWTVTTNNANGYTLNVHASTTPALRSAGSSVADYTPSVANTPETWSVASGAAEFGFSARGTNIVAGFGSDTDCINTADVPSATLNWRNFNGATGINIASTNAPTTPSGATSMMCVAVQQNNTYIASGTYTATITGTATATP